VVINTVVKGMVPFPPTIEGNSIRLEWAWQYMGDPVQYMEISKRSGAEEQYHIIEMLYGEPFSYLDNSSMIPDESQQYSIRYGNYGTYYNPASEFIVTMKKIYPYPENVLDVNYYCSFDGIRIEWDYGEGTEAAFVEIYKQIQENVIILLGTSSREDAVFVNTSVNENENIVYYFRTFGTNGNYSLFVNEEGSNKKNHPQIELGLGGESLRHAIFSSHDDISAERNVLLFKLWKSEEEDASTEPNTDNYDMALKGSKELRIKNILPFITDDFNFGAELKKWNSIFSKNTYADDTETAKLVLWNGK
jgi:hypothetical protein